MGVIEDLKKERIKDDTFLNSLVENLYSKCLNMIKMKNKLDVTAMIYEVPYIHLGYPVYDCEEVTLKLNSYLKKQGFKTTYYPKNKIYISW